MFSYVMYLSQSRYLSKSSIEGYFLTSRFTGLVTLAGELYDRSDRYALRPIVRRMSYAPLGGRYLIVGSKFYSEQYMGREKIKYTGEISESIENEKITIKFSFPMSLIVKKIQWIIKTEDEYTTFTAITYLQFGWVFRTLFPKKILKLIEDQNEHVAFEGEILKKILENQEDSNPITQ